MCNLTSSMESEEGELRSERLSVCVCVCQFTVVIGFEVGVGGGRPAYR